MAETLEAERVGGSVNIRESAVEERIMSLHLLRTIDAYEDALWRLYVAEDLAHRLGQLALERRIKATIRHVNKIVAQLDADWLASCEEMREEDHAWN
jgi:hypothetical protein